MLNNYIVDGDTSATSPKHGVALVTNYE